jgi:hypothetical protein
VQTPKEKGNDQSGDADRYNFQIVPAGLRLHTEEETAELTAKFTQEVYAEHAGKLQTWQGVRLWWLKKRLDWKVASRVREFQHKGI